MLVVFSRSVWRVCVPIVLSILCANVLMASDNLLVNTSFRDGKIGQTDFGWELELSKDSGSSLAVVEGREPSSTALRISHESLGSSSYIKQKVKVQPWRWYRAEVWVNSEKMAPFGFSPYLGLEGGRKVHRGGVGYEERYDAVDVPIHGWRCLQVVAHSAGQDFVTIMLGGHFSGEIRFCNPVVRECSLVEAAGVDPTSRAYDPRNWGMARPEQGDFGYVYPQEVVSRVVSGFPDPLYLYGRMDTKAPQGRVSLILPAGIRFRRHQLDGVTATVSDISEGRQRVELPPAGSHALVVDSELNPGEKAIGFVQYEWEGGFQSPAPIVFEGIRFPKVPPPKRLTMTLGISGNTWRNWEKSPADGSDCDAAMISDLRRFGFNSLEIWGGDARPYYERGMPCATAGGINTFNLDLQKYLDALAVSRDGKPIPGIVCPSYRGPAFNDVLDRVRKAARLASRLSLDEEHYVMSGSHAPAICYCDRCIGRWEQWKHDREPNLSDDDPRSFARKPHLFPDHCQAWLRFRCELVAERYALAREAFLDAVKQAGTATWETPALGGYLGGNQLQGLHSNAALGGSLDYHMNMVYDTGDGVRQRVAQLAPQSGDRLLVALAPGYMCSPIGDARSQVLESVMGGSRGAVFWAYYIGTTAGHLADISDAVRMLTPVEDVILDGSLEEGYRADREGVVLQARAKSGKRALLVSDYSSNPGPISITVPGEDALKVIDLYSDDVVGTVTSKDRTFVAPGIRRDFQARLYLLQPAEQQ